MSENKLIKRGLEDLLKEHHVDDVLEDEVILEIDLDKITPNPFQPRKSFNQEKINELAESIEEHGVFQPIILKKIKDGYMIVSGERRYRASKQVGLLTIPSIIRQYEEKKVMEIALIENLQRENLTPIEEAKAYNYMMDNLKMTHQQLATRVGKSRSHVTNTIGLLQLPEQVQQYLLEEKISMSHARVLSKLDSKRRIQTIANQIIRKQLNVREVEEIAKKEIKSKQLKRQVASVYVNESKILSEKLGANVEIKGKNIIIKTKKDSDIQHILAMLIDK